MPSPVPRREVVSIAARMLVAASLVAAAAPAHAAEAWSKALVKRGIDPALGGQPDRDHAGN